MTVGDEVLDVPGILKHQTGRRNTTFGVDFQEQVHQLNVQIPPIILKCVAEVEKRGMEVKGLYRVSGVKSTVEKLCQRFEIDPTSVILDDVHPNVLSSVLKQYLRHLPEPLMTFKLYPEFIKAAKDFMEKRITNDQAVENYHYIVQKLPISNHKTSAVLMHHLQRVASHSEKNQMSAANLGIVFGPTLLKPHEGSASLATLVDTPHQTNAIEMLISSAQTIFGPADQFLIEHGETPIENIPELQVTQCDKMPGLSQDKHLEMKLEERTIQSEESEKKSETSSSKDISRSTKTDKNVDYGLPGCTTDVSSFSLKQVNTNEISTLYTQPTYGAVSLVPSISVTDRTDVNLTVTEKLPSHLKPTAFESQNVSNVVVAEIPDKKGTKPKTSSLPCSKRSQMVKYLPKASKADVPKGVSCSSSTCSRSEPITKTSPKISVKFKNINFPIAKATIVSKINPSKSSSHVQSTESKSASGQTLASKIPGSGSEITKYSNSPSGKSKGTKVEKQISNVKKTESGEKSRSPQFV
ncbi:hypothetical protein LOTGIDRAFT_230660 [Lottia gigantea]|uniref:Rho-GAP domain-containing protein n=1 Tax=Lottia gigantea TaxID=225164 RepID=V4B1U0_LOTGI|nr:hypothetical protein LOTGIDRAFT_230660 [Lottia gigantea]ESP01321.1 hypothetical protein LOTGIDRAFT_230660 [Lottia gigantea]